MSGRLAALLVGSLVALSAGRARAQIDVVPPPPAESVRPVDVELALADARYARGAYASACALFRHATSVGAWSARSLSALGYCELRAHDAASAIGPLERAVGLEPASGRVHVWYGVALALDGRVDEAAASYRRALRLDPQDAMARDARLILASHDVDATWLLVSDDRGQSQTLTEELRQIEEESSSIAFAYVGGALGALVGLGAAIPLLLAGASSDPCGMSGVCARGGSPEVLGAGVAGAVLAAIAVGLLVSAIVRDVDVTARRTRWRVDVHRTMGGSIDGDPVEVHRMTREESAAWFADDP